MTKTFFTMMAMAAALCARTANAETVQIASSSDWATFANRVNAGETGLNAVMTADVTLTQDSPRVGCDSYPYAGSFDGDGHTLTLKWNLPDVQHVAPFSIVAGATISKLHTTGSITMSLRESCDTGLVGGVKAPGVTVERCRSSVVITSNLNNDDASIAGLIGDAAWSSMDVTITDCLFDGSLIAENAYNVGGFIVYMSPAPNVAITRSLFAPRAVKVSIESGSSTFVRGYYDSITACYYTTKVGDSQGTDASSMSAATLVEALGENWTVKNGKAMLKVFDGAVKLSDGEIYTVAGNETLQGDAGVSPISVAENASAVINIKSGATLTVTGGSASGTTGAAPAIYVPSSSKLYIVGDGKLIATGANGGGYSGGGGTRTSGESSSSYYNYQSNAGWSVTGAGGAGGSGGSQGGSGNFFAMSTVSLSASPSRTASTLTAQTSGAPTDSITVTFVSVGSTVGTATATLMFAPPSAPAVTRSGYVFLGYYTSSGKQIYGADLKAVYSVWQTVENTTLYAQWLRLSYLTFKSDGETVGTRTAQKGNALPSAPSVSKTDWSFLGYYTATSEGTQVYNESLVAQMSTWDSTEDFTYYAQWQPVSVPFTVTLYSDGAVVGTISARQSYEIESVTPPTKERNKFAGYWTSETDDGTKIFNADGSPVESTWTYYEDMNLYAHWVQIRTITFVSQDATVGTAEISLDEADVTVSIPIRSGSGDYVFLGYYTDSGDMVFDENGALVEGALSGVSEETKFYAQWTVPEGSIAKIVYRGQLNLLTGEPAVHDTTYEKTMHFRLYDGSEAETPLWPLDYQTETGIVVKVNADGSFVQTFGDETLTELLATGTVTHVGLVIGNSAGLATEMKPRRALRPVAAVNRALTAEAAAPRRPRLRRFGCCLRRQRRSLQGPQERILGAARRHSLRQIRLSGAEGLLLPDARHTACHRHAGRMALVR